MATRTLRGFKHTNYTTKLLGFVTALFLLAILALPQMANAQTDRPMRILVTNDDGIEELEERLVPLAQELRRFADVTIVVANQDRSGSTHYMRLNRKKTIDSQAEYVSEGENGLHRLAIYIVDGYPGDCVAVGIGGIMADNPPDLVISGPNGGPNLADGWLGSGTIGAARIAAYSGTPAIAISGLDDGEPEQVKALSRWVAALAQSDIVKSLPKLTYLTIGFPRVSPDKIAGIRVAPRARLVEGFTIEQLGEVTDSDGDDEVTTVWMKQFNIPVSALTAESDVVLHSQNYIVVTPMRADEHNRDLLNEWGQNEGLWPAWPPE